ncbi:hypothetical protein [Bacillus atrophaeus]|uniref:hypothetical protein n=1 Tax=Bacillus atrophaeus TaxID=1452 RepID=UPI00227F8F44|nr:hypothetical protein [Bacillus atrophaeus]MCY8478069.1 hypothetical protein [Bacillus atrophaeus]MED1017903.1 hypothetical protein [Bacillus atrophaeus]MED1032529.1 hypothetical protein [Bacillus atrophaeus]MED1121025.1 hypothetical protein [Bacillus atrophaeus]
MKKELAAMLEEKKRSQSKLEQNEIVMVLDAIGEFADKEEFEPAFYLQRFLSYHKRSSKWGWLLIGKFLEYLKREEKKLTEVQ